jgi:cytochrome c-type protein NapC
MSNSTEATPQRRASDQPSGRLGRIWQFFMRPSVKYALGSILVVGFVGGVVVWGGFNWAMELTNTETFCISCHEMERNVYREYQKTAHYSNDSGVRATCPDCHVPRPWIHKVARKIQATNELFHHFAGTIDTREKYEAKRLQLAKNVWTVMKSTDSRECRNCHDFGAMDFSQQESRAGKRHQDALDKGMTCIDCHKGIAHELPEGAFEAERKLSNK